MSEEKIDQIAGIVLIILFGICSWIGACGAV